MLCTCHSVAQPGTPANWANLGFTLKWADPGSEGQQLQGEGEQEEVPEEFSALYTSGWATEFREHRCQLDLFVLELAVSGKEPKRRLT